MYLFLSPCCSKTMRSYSVSILLHALRRFSCVITDFTYALDIILKFIKNNHRKGEKALWTIFSSLLILFGICIIKAMDQSDHVTELYIYSFMHGETFSINFYYRIFQFREKRINLRIFVRKNSKLYNNDMKLQHSS